MSREEVDDALDIPAALRERARRVCEELRALQQEALAAAGRPPGAAPPAALTLTWTPTTAADALAAEALRQAHVALSVPAVFQAGRVYCYRCAAATCEHAAPPTPGTVFTGYDNAGQPRWEELFQALLALDDERVNLLFAAPPQFLARLVGRPRLIGDQFVSSGRNSLTYRVLGQAIAGYFSVAGQRCALTVQVVEDASRTLNVQVLAPEFVLVALADAPASSPLHRAHDAVRELRRQVRELEAAWRQAQGKVARQQQLDRVFVQLRHVTNSLERHGRQASRRTQHAQQRSVEQRPVPTASEDLRAATPADLFLDRRHQSVVVRGRRGRAHVFSLEGRHVTSLSLPADLFDRRCQRQRYVALAPSEARDWLRRATAPDAAPAPPPPAPPPG